VSGSTFTSRTDTDGKSNHSLLSFSMAIQLLVMARRIPSSLCSVLPERDQTCTRLPMKELGVCDILTHLASNGYRLVRRQQDGFAVHFRRQQHTLRWHAANGGGLQVSQHHNLPADDIL